MNTYISIRQNDFTKSVDFFKQEISILRTGRASAAILDRIAIDAYGAKSLLNTIASIQIQDARCLIVSTWDKNLLKDAEKAIVDANLGVGVVNEGDKIRVSIPQMTEENRKELVKQLNEKHESARINIRKIRDEIKTSIENAQKSKEITEDDKFTYIKELEEEIHSQYNTVKDIKDKKETDIMTV